MDISRHGRHLCPRPPDGYSYGASFLSDPSAFPFHPVFLYCFHPNAMDIYAESASFPSLFYFGPSPGSPLTRRSSSERAYCRLFWERTARPGGGCGRVSHCPTGSDQSRHRCEKACTEWAIEKSQGQALAYYRRTDSLH